MALAATSRRRILLVEDNGMIGRELQVVLDRRGFEVTGLAASIEEALGHIARRPLDAAILDVDLDGKPTVPVAEALTRKGIPFMVVTGYARASLPPAFVPAPYLAKPFAIEPLLAMLGGLLSGGPFADDKTRRLGTSSP